MRWYKAIAYKSVQIGIDELKNPICNIQKAFEFSVRFTPYVPTHDQTDGNKFDLVSRTFFTRLPASSLSDVVEISVKGERYSVDDLMIDGRYTAIRVRSAK